MISPKPTKKATISMSSRKDCEKDGRQTKLRNSKNDPRPLLQHNSSFSSCCSDTSIASIGSACSSENVRASDTLQSSTRSARRRSLTFDDNVNVIIIPRIHFFEDHDEDDEDDFEDEGEVQAAAVEKTDLVKRGDLFYLQHEINLWRCEEKMRQQGMDPDNFDWRSMR